MLPTRPRTPTTDERIPMIQNLKDARSKSKDHMIQNLTFFFANTNLLGEDKEGKIGTSTLKKMRLENGFRGLTKPKETRNCDSEETALFKEIKE